MLTCALKSTDICLKDIQMTGLKKAMEQMREYIYETK